MRCQVTRPGAVRLAVAGAVVWLLAGPGLAAPPKKAKAGPTERFGITWAADVAEAQKEAGAKGKEKPVFVFRVLGDLDGFT
jgi:hypothetical protein